MAWLSQKPTNARRPGRSYQRSAVQGELHLLWREHRRSHKKVKVSRCLFSTSETHAWTEDVRLVGNLPGLRQAIAAWKLWIKGRWWLMTGA